MNVLLVDDDHFVIKVLEQKIAWKSLGVDKVFSANNMVQAQQIINTADIKLLISDIEMPMGSGLELLSWVRSEGYDLQAIFLTNYANFNYAQKAIELQSFEYYLKPIDADKLTLVISKAINKIKSQENVLVSRLDSDTSSFLKEKFWKRLLALKNKVSLEIVSDLFEGKPLYKSEDIFLPLIITFYPYKLSGDYQILSARKEKGIFDNNFKNIFAEEFSCLPFEVLMEYNKESFLAIFHITSDSKLQMIRKLEQSCNDLIHRCNMALDCPLSCAVGSPSDLSSFNTNFEVLLDMEQNMVNLRNKVISVRNYKKISVTNVDFHPSYWEKYLLNKDKDNFINNFKKYLNDLYFSDCLNYTVLNSIRIDLTQLIYSFLGKNGISAHQLFNEEISAFLSERAVCSLEDFINFIDYHVHISLEYLAFSASQQSIVQIVCDYINNNYHENLNREVLGRIVYLNPDYVARVFKNKMGISPGNYIIKKRLEVAKDLLVHTNLPINLIAEKVGYNNYSYFIKLFGRETGYTPLAYRKQFTRNNSMLK